MSSYFIFFDNIYVQVHFHQELLILFWKLCEHNKRFMYHVLKSSDVLEVVIASLSLPIISLSLSGCNPCPQLSQRRPGGPVQSGPDAHRGVHSAAPQVITVRLRVMMMIMIIIMIIIMIMMLSGERNFGVRLNKPYTAAVPMDISVFR